MNFVVREPEGPSAEPEDPMTVVARAGAVVEPPSALVEQTLAALGRGGALAQADPGFVERGMQQCLAEAAASAIEDRAALVAEAGTGVGKTFAYLVPLLLSLTSACSSRCSRPTSRSAAS